MDQAGSHRVMNCCASASMCEFEQLIDALNPTGHGQRPTEPRAATDSLPQRPQPPRTRTAGQTQLGKRARDPHRSVPFCIGAHAFQPRDALEPSRSLGSTPAPPSAAPADHQRVAPSPSRGCARSWRRALSLTVLVPRVPSSIQLSSSRNSGCASEIERGNEINNPTCGRFQPAITNRARPAKCSILVPVRA
jgi:hypothetical protein